MTQELINGSIASALLPLLKKRQPEKVLFVTGRHLSLDAVFQKFLNGLRLPFQTVHPPEGLLQVDQLPRFEGLHTVIAIGGGKVIDFAKGIIHQSGNEPYFVAVPTTAGSGSEATPFAVLYNGREKVSLDAPNLLPQLAVLDASLVNNLPAKQKAISGGDAFAQCVEAFWNVNRNLVSDVFALNGMQQLYRQLPVFIHSTDEALALEMLQAAHLAGNAIALTRTTGPHALSYYLTAYHHVPHGQAVALFLPLFFIYNDAPQAAKKLQAIYKVLNAGNAEEALEICRRFFSSLGLATTFAEAGLNDVDVEQLLLSVNQQRFANNPVAYDAVKLKALIRRYLC